MDSWICNKVMKLSLLESDTVESLSESGKTRVFRGDYSSMKNQMVFNFEWKIDSRHVEVIYAGNSGLFYGL